MNPLPSIKPDLLRKIEVKKTTAAILHGALRVKFAKMVDENPSRGGNSYNSYNCNSIVSILIL